MKKRIRKLMCLALVALLVATMTVPAMAEYVGSGQTASGNNFTVHVTCYETIGSAVISTTIPTTVKAYVKNTLYNELNDLPGGSEDVSTGYASATAIADNIILEERSGWDDRYYESTNSKTYGKLWGEDVLVCTGSDYPA